MPEISNFLLQLVDADYNHISQGSYDLAITEPGLNARIDLGGPNPTFTGAQLGQLADQGRTVIGYLNLSVTDHYRTYWNDNWVDFAGTGGGGLANRDVGALTADPTIESWLSNHYGYAGDFGYIVDYADPTWQARVIAEAVDLVTPTAQGGAGYHGLFLDDFGRYYDAYVNEQARGGTTTLATLAGQMIDFVNTLSTAVRAVNPDAYLAINGGAYVAWHAGSPLNANYQTLLGNIDALMMESQYGNVAWPDAMTNFGSNIDFLAVEHLTRISDPDAFAAWARSGGLVPHVTNDAAYDEPPVTPLPGTPGNDIITGGSGPNLLHGFGGRDHIRGLDGNDRLLGGFGADTLMGGAGNDTLLGGGSHDVLRGGHDQDALRGGDGNDRLYGDGGDDTLVGEAGNDRIFGGTGDDQIVGGSGANLLVGGAGNDALFGGTSSDTLNGGAGTDTLTGNSGGDMLRGHAGHDIVLAGDGDDFVFGGSGNDHLRGHAGNDQMSGDAGNDSIFGGAGNDTLWGGDGDDLLIGGAGDDVFHTGAGADTIVTGQGNDSFVADADDVVFYGTEAEYFASLSAPQNDSTIFDPAAILSDFLGL